MKQNITISSDDIIDYLKISCQFPTILDGVVTCKIIETKAEELGIKIDTKELQQASDDFRLSRQLYAIDSTQAWLRRHHLSLDEFETSIYTNALSRKLVEHLFGSSVESFFYQHKLDYTNAAVYEVVLEDEDLAMELFCALQEGEVGFQEIARQYITEPYLRMAGGYLGIVSRRDLKPEISSAVFAAHPPEFLKPIVTSTGIHLILVEEIIQPELNEAMRGIILNDLFAQWLKEQIEKIEVVTRLNPKTQTLVNGKTSN
jgi:parvulin-like peptidyl-prolyl isomerase